MHAKAILRISLVILCTIPVISDAQITITKDHMPKVDDAIEFSTASPIGINVSKTGANTSWDYSKLAKITDGVDEYKASYKTPYLLNFGFTALGKKLRDTLGFSSFQLKNIYNFYRNDSKSFRDVGVGFQFAAIPLPQSGKHSDPDEIFVFPLNYGNKDTTTFEVEVPISAGIRLGSYYRSGTRMTEVDGWGTITTPYLKNEPCIRVKSTIVGLDSIKVSTPSINFGQEVTRVEYTWLSTSERIPVMKVSGTIALGNFTPTSVTYRNEWSKAPQVTADFNVTNTTIKVGSVFKINNESKGDNLTYTWSITPSSDVKYVNGSDNTSEHPSVVISTKGQYTVTLVARSGSVSDTMTKTNYITIDANSSITEVSTVVSWGPNPSYGRLTFTGDVNACPKSIQLYTVDGKLLTNSVVNSYNQSVDLSSIAEGVYYISWVDARNIRHRSKLLIGNH